MSGNLLCTNVALQSEHRSVSLSRAIRKAIDAGPNFLSVITYWEITLKSMKGKLEVGDPRLWWIETLNQLAATPLPLRPEHISEVNNLSSIHNDPFDRVLIAQAIFENLTLLTTDATIPKYASKRFRVIS